MGLGQKGEDVTTLINKKQYAKAIELIKTQLKSAHPDPRLRLQFGDVLALTGRNKEAVTILLPLADEFAREGFAAKAISVLKKIQKLEPGRRDIEGRLASLIETKQRQATSALPPIPPSSSSEPEIGMEEIGFEPPPGGSLAVPAAPSAAAPTPTGMDLGIEDLGLATPSERPFRLDLDEAPPIALQPSAPTPARAATTSAAPASPAPVQDWDLLAGGEEDSSPFAVPTSEPEPPEDLGLESIGGPLEVEPTLDLDELDAEPVVEGDDAGPAGATPILDETFRRELLSTIDEIFPSGMEGAFPAPAEEDSAAAGSQIVVSPLFKDFSVDEMVAVIQGLRLLTFEARKVILRQGDPGASLYMLTSGRARAFVKNAEGKQVPVGDLDEGAFFGEISILTGKPRMATVVAVTPCELLELDRPTLDSIVAQHPHVRDVLQEFARQRVRAR
jgi:hypothetical protein